MYYGPGLRMQGGYTAGRVIHVRDGVRDGVLAEGAVYIGDRIPPWMSPTGLYLPRSDWCNPFKIDKPDKPREGTREEVIEKYERYMISERPDLLERLGEVEGKTLACSCKPRACHGDVLLRLAEAVRIRPSARPLPSAPPERATSCRLDSVSAD
jgi:hypothetical protein